MNIIKKFENFNFEEDWDWEEEFPGEIDYKDLKKGNIIYAKNDFHMIISKSLALKKDKGYIILNVFKTLFFINSEHSREHSFYIDNVNKYFYKK